MTASVARPGEPPTDVLVWLRANAPWLTRPELGTCVVGTHALALACGRAGLAAPRPKDLDLAWALDPQAGERLLRDCSAFVATTAGNVARGTLACKVADQRIEITTFRDGDATLPLPARIERDLRARDMTVGALAVELATGRVHDPTGGLDHWQQRRIVPVGDATERVREHAVRWLRYWRKAREWGFEVDAAVRKIALPKSVLDAVPAEAIAQELRAALLHCASPGRFCLDLFEQGLLQQLAPDLARQFDGRPAGPQQWHPEVAQGLHLILALEWAAAAATAAQLDDRDRLAVLVAVLGHDLGKSVTPPAEWPGHRGHEQLGLQPLDALLDRWPGLADQRGRTLARTTCLLHVVVRDFAALRAGTLARLYDEHFRARDFPVELFALAVAADAAGRLGFAAQGESTRAQVARDLHWLRACCDRVDAAALRAQHGELDAFKSALHDARARAIAAGRAAASAPEP